MLQRNCSLAAARPPGKAPKLSISALPWGLLGSPGSSLRRAYAGLWGVAPEDRSLTAHEVSASEPPRTQSVFATALSAGVNADAVALEQLRGCCAKSVAVLRSRLDALRNCRVLDSAAILVEPAHSPGVASEPSGDMCAVVVRVVGKGTCEEGAALCAADSGVIVGFVTTTGGAGQHPPGGIAHMSAGEFVRCGGTAQLRNPASPELAFIVQLSSMSGL